MNWSIILGSLLGTIIGGVIALWTLKRGIENTLDKASQDMENARREVREHLNSRIKELLR